MLHEPFPNLTGGNAMCKTVCKFGGSSVSDAGMFVRVNHIIKSNPARRYIVLSAPGKRSADDHKITDLFIAAYDGSRRGDYSILAQIFERYASIRRCLCPAFNLEMEFALIRKKLHTSLDYAASRGEYLCAKLFSAYSGLPFVDATELLVFGNDGTIDMPLSRRNVHDKLLIHERAVIPGFYAADLNGGIRTFSRGGSDISGALIAALTDASLYENWTDVDGLYTADPNIVPNPRRNHRVSLAQMRHICTAGASLLHPDALTPLMGRKIDTLLKNTFSPGAEGTRISEDTAENVLCVTGKQQMYMVARPVDCADTRPILYDLPPENSVPISAVNVFGLTTAQFKSIEALINPIHIIHMQDYVQIIIPRQQYETTIRAVHAILLEEN